MRPQARRAAALANASEVLAQTRERERGRAEVRAAAYREGEHLNKERLRRGERRGIKAQSCAAIVQVTPLASMRRRRAP